MGNPLESWRNPVAGGPDRPCPPYVRMPPPSPGGRVCRSAPWSPSSDNLQRHQRGRDFAEQQNPEHGRGGRLSADHRIDVVLVSILTRKLCTVYTAGRTPRQHAGAGTRPFPGRLQRIPPSTPCRITGQHDRRQEQVVKQRSVHRIPLGSGPLGQNPVQRVEHCRGQACGHPSGRQRLPPSTTSLTRTHPTMLTATQTSFLEVILLPNTALGHCQHKHWRHAW